MEKNFNFTTAFAMRCDAEQFESVRKELTAMGYMTFRSIVEGEYLCTNYAGVNNEVGLSGAGTYQKDLIIETFNRELCLALAAMTDKPDGIVGEWFVHVADTDQFFTKNKLYKKQTNVTFGTFTDDNRDDHGMGIDGIKEWFRKATADELIKYFTESVVISASATNCQAFGNDAKASNYTPIEFKGQLQGFPAEVVEKMLERQVEQGNKRNMRVFELAEYRDDAGGGFNWSKTVEGYTFWNHVIDKKDFDLFFKLYPKTNKPETDPQIEALQKRIEDLEYNVKQLAESMQKVKEPEPQPASRFADKQPLWAWEDGWKTVREGVFWDAKNECIFGQAGIRGGYDYDNYEPIPADQIPAWMIEAAKHLED